jgi:hypothetical protein
MVAYSGNFPPQFRQQEAHDPAPHTDAQSISSAVVILPNNDRDPELTRALREAQDKYFARKQRRQQS